MCVTAVSPCGPKTSLTSTHKYCQVSSKSKTIQRSTAVVKVAWIRTIPTVDLSSKKRQQNLTPAKWPDCYQVDKAGYSASNRKLKLGMQLKLAMNLDPRASNSQVLKLQMFTLMPLLATQLEMIQMNKEFINILVENCQPRVTYHVKTPF